MLTSAPPLLRPVKTTVGLKMFYSTDPELRLYRRWTPPRSVPGDRDGDAAGGDPCVICPGLVPTGPALNP